MAKQLDGLKKLLEAAPNGGAGEQLTPAAGERQAPKTEQSKEAGPKAGASPSSAR